MIFQHKFHIGNPIVPLPPQLIYLYSRLVNKNAVSHLPSANKLVNHNILQFPGTLITFLGVSSLQIGSLCFNMGT